MAQACNTSYVGGWDQEGRHKFKPNLHKERIQDYLGKYARVYLKIKRKKGQSYCLALRRP